MTDLGWTEKDIAVQQRVLVDEQLARMYDSNPPAHFAVIDKVVTWLKKSGENGPVTLLDAGCASAYYYEIINYYHLGWCIYTGLDYNAEMLALAKSYYPDIKTILFDLRAVHLDDCAFDVVLSGAALMHIRDWREALVELMRVADKWLLLHRTWVYTDGTPTTISTGSAYGHPAWYLRFNEAELLSLMTDFTLAQEWDSGEGGSGSEAIKTYLFRRDDEHTTMALEETAE